MSDGLDSDQLLSLLQQDDRREKKVLYRPHPESKFFEYVRPRESLGCFIQLFGGTSFRYTVTCDDEFTKITCITPANA
jgi:hypothetical protein